MTKQERIEYNRKLVGFCIGHKMGGLSADVFAYIIHKIVFDDSDLKTAIRVAAGQAHRRFISRLESVKAAVPQSVIDKILTKLMPARAF